MLIMSYLTDRKRMEYGIYMYIHISKFPELETSNYFELFFFAAI